MTDKTKSIVITGCSSGIGRDAAFALRERNWRVFATCRSESDCEKLRAEGFESLVIDYEDEATIEQGAATILERTGGTIDALFNNGAYAIPGAVEDLPRDAIRTIFEANVFGYLDLTNRLLPAMRQQGHGRILNCSSVLGFTALKFRGAYVATKFALEGLTDCLRLELRGTPIKVILIEPGPITTEFRRNSRPQFEKWIKWQDSAIRHRYEKALIPALYDDSTSRDFGELPASSVTAKLIKALESPNPSPRYYVTTPTYFCAAIKRLLPTRMSDRILARQ